MKILEPQQKNHFVGREQEIKELKENIRDNSIVVVKGSRGIGKTNLMMVVKEDLQERGRKCHFINGVLFQKQMEEIFKPSWLSRITEFSSPFGGIGWNSKEPFILEPMEKSGEKIIFVENAQELNKNAFGLIFEAITRNNQLRFILEIPTPYIKDINLKAGSYRVVEIGELDHGSTIQLVKNAYPNFSDDIVEKIADISRGYPYIARGLVYICTNRKTEKKMLEFLQTLRDDETYILDQIHKEVLDTLGKDARDNIYKLAIAPPILTLKLIDAFCGEDFDHALNDMIDRGILITEKELYQIYHPLFRDHLRKKQQFALENNKKRIYCDAMEKVKSKSDSIYMLFEVLNEPAIFKELIEIAENYHAINFVGAQCIKWGEFDQANVALSRVLKIAGKTKNKKWRDEAYEALALGNIGIIYRIKGDLEIALQYSKKALELNMHLRSEEGIVSNYGNIGNIYLIKGELDKALEYFEKALELNKEIGGTDKILGNIGVIYKIKGELDKALEYYERALKIHEEIGDKDGIATQLGNIGNIYRTKRESGTAIKYLEKALKLNEEIKDKDGVAIGLGNIGNVYLTEEDYDKALQYYIMALKLSEEIGKKEGRAIQLGNIGSVYGIKGELDKALEYYDRALILNKELGRKKGMAVQLENMGILYGKKGDFDKELEYLDKALKIFKEIGSKIEIAQTLMNIGNFYVKKCENERALDIYLDAQEYAIDNPSLFNDINIRINELLGIG